MSISDKPISRRPCQTSRRSIFFAGEATAAPYYQLCSGAYTSGETAAGETIAVIG
jgi:hypothetical protein